jgi:hypothetical protein
MKILNLTVIAGWLVCAGLAAVYQGEKMKAVTLGLEPPSEMGLAVAFVVTCTLTLIAIARS